jgi:outer membrane receptor protein involved in Fe transport
MHNNVRIAVTAAAACSMALLQQPLRAQAVEQGEESKTEEAPLQTITVTGSLLPTTPDQAAVPIVALDAKALEQSGVASNPLEILRKSIPAFEGRSNAGTSNANNDNQRTAGGSQLQLRNLPTLVLINGQRVANSAIGGLNGKNFVDVNQIPAAAIARIEVLTDGASSIYGSDAIGGVVNFILKSDVDGIWAGGRYGGAQGGYKERSGYVTAGTDVGGWKLTATGSYNKTDPLFQNQRSFTSPLYGKTSSIPGVVSGGNAILAPGLSSPNATNPTGAGATATSLAQLIANGTYVATTPGAIANGFDVSPYQTLLLQQEQDSFVGNVSKDLFGDRVELTGDVLYSHDKSFTQWQPVPVTGITVPAGAPFNPLTTAFGGVVFSDLNQPKQFFNTTDAVWANVGLRGKLWEGWHWDTDVDYSQSDLRQLQANLIFKPNVPLAIAGGYDASGNAVAGGAYSQVHSSSSITGPLITVPALDPFARSGLDPTTLANLYGTEVIKARSQLVSWEGKVDGKVFELPAGDIVAAVGAAWRRETLAGHTDANGRNTDPVTGLTTGNDQFWIGGTFADPFVRHRDIRSVFAETRIPITSDRWGVPGLQDFDLTLAVRNEHYSDAGKSTVPKYGFRWQPFDKQFTVRGNYSKSFSAPSLYAEYGPTDTRQVAGTVVQGVFGPNYQGMPFNGEDGNNPNLKPPTSVSRSIGFVLQPNAIRGLTVNVDFSSITLHGFAGGIGFNSILQSVNALGSASPFFKNLGVDNFVGSAGASQPFIHPGDLQTFLTNPGTGKGDPVAANRLFIIDQFQNLAVLQEQSFTTGVNYQLPWDEIGNWSFSSTGAIFKSFNFQALPGQQFIQYAGTTNNAGGSGGFGGTLPKYRFFTTIDWAYEGWDVSINNSYMSSTVDTGVNGTSTPTIPVASYITWDMRVAYEWHFQESNDRRVLTTALGVNNIADRMPPLAPRAFLDNNADVATFSPLGRLIYLTVNVSL